MSTRLGHYELLALLGAGGMGEVYRARDLTLDREVALKLLPPGVQDDRHRLERFAQEARSTARLSHPNILVVHELAEEGSDVFLVSELLEGQTLRQRLAPGALPWRKAVDYASQVCAGLAAAHERGIVHCDLKPENLFITGADRIKILDFGLARLTEDRPGEPPPTATLTLYSDAAIRGTLGYLAPEQVRRGEVDERADLFALGAILYEMLCGRRAFQTNSPAEALGAILTEDPPRLPGTIPSVLARIGERCLEKEPAARFRSAHDLGLALEAVAAMSEPSAWARFGSSIGRKRWRGIAVGTVVLGALALAFAAGSYRASRAPSASPPRVSFSISLPEGTGLAEFTAAPIAFSPDGRSLILARDGERGTQLWLRHLDSETLTPIAGTEGATSPFLSPDGESIAFAADGKLKRIGVTGGVAQIVADAPQFFGGCWLNDNTIVYAPRFALGLWRVTPSGGEPTQLAGPERAGPQAALVWPTCLPDGRTVLYTQWRWGKQVDESAIGYITLDGARQGVLIEGGFHPRYLSPGMLLFVRLGTLMAVPFDPNAVTLSGSARPLQRGVLANVNSLVAFYETSSAGHLAFLEGEYAQPARRLVWMDRRGERTPASALTRPFSSPRISSDGRLILTWIQDAEVAVWLLSLGRDRLTRVTRGMDDHTAAWLPDGQRFVFDSSRSGNYDLYLGGVESPAQETQLTVEPIGHFVNTSLSDGRLALTSYDVGKDSDLWLMDTRAGAQPEPILQTPFSESEPAFSADGKLIAYVSEEANTKEVYVQRFPLAGPRVIASGNGGEEPSWSRSGTELYYRKGSDLFAVQVKAEGALEVTSPQRLFSGRFHYNLYPTNTYDVAPDGRFLMVEEAPPERRAIRVTLFLGDALRRDAALRQER